MSRVWEKLYYGMERGECVLFLGPDLPRVTSRGSASAPMAGLGQRLAEGLGDVEGAAAPNGEARRENDRLTVGAFAQEFLKRDDDVGLEIVLQEWHAGVRGEESLLHDDLAALPFEMIISSAHDPLMEEALGRAGKDPHVRGYNYRGDFIELAPVASVESPLLFHLFGQVREPESVVLTELQRLDYLEALLGRNPALPRDVSEALTNNRFFLFLGFGLGRWYLRVLLHFLNVLRPRSQSFAVELLDGPGADAGHSVLFFRDNFKFEILDEDATEFIPALRQGFEPRAVTGDRPESVGPAVRTMRSETTVFICHASEDADIAARVHDLLERAGLDPWLDKESLRGGDLWDDKIEETIEEVDYVVILNSRALADKARGRAYVNKEINVAKRAQDMSLGSFIIPVMIDDSPLLKVLDDYHAVNLTEADGETRLIRAIKRDMSEALR